MPRARHYEIISSNFHWFCWSRSQETNSLKSIVMQLEISPFKDCGLSAANRLLFLCFSSSFQRRFPFNSPFSLLVLEFVSYSAHLVFSSLFVDISKDSWNFVEIRWQKWGRERMVSWIHRIVYEFIRLFGLAGRLYGNHKYPPFFYSRCTINIEPHPRIARPAMATSEVAALRPCPARAPTHSPRHLRLTLLQPAVQFSLIWLPPRDRRNNSHKRNNQRKLNHPNPNNSHRNSNSFLSPIKTSSSSCYSNK